MPTDQVEREDRFLEAFRSNRRYFEIMQKHHAELGGAAVETEVRQIITSECSKPTTRNVLDAGCGEGSVLLHFAQLFPEVHFQGVDISPVAVDMARSRVVNNAQFEIASVKELPWPDGFFDFAYSQSVIEHVVDYPAALQEIYRVLKPGGGILIRVENGDSSSTLWYRRLPNLVFRNNKQVPLPATLQLDPEDEVGSHRTNFDATKIPSDVLLRQLERLGLKIEYFTTRFGAAGRGRRSLNPKILARSVISGLKFWPFSHLGPTTVVLARKR